jgi:hypothetical protein
MAVFRDDPEAYAERPAGMVPKPEGDESADGATTSHEPPAEDTPADAEGAAFIGPLLPGQLPPGNDEGC